MRHDSKVALSRVAWLQGLSIKGLSRLSFYVFAKNWRMPLTPILIQLKWVIQIIRKSWHTSFNHGPLSVLPIRIDGISNVSRVFIDWSKVTVSISERRVDLNGSGVTLNGSLDVLHFLKCIAHVGICISECWMDSEINRFWLHITYRSHYEYDIRPCTGLKERVNGGTCPQHMQRAACVCMGEHVSNVCQMCVYMCVCVSVYVCVCVCVCVCVYAHNGVWEPQ